MFISNIHGKESINTLAQQIGCKVGECLHSASYGKPALAGNTFGIKDQLKAAGGRWDAGNKAWTFESWSAMESALNSIIKTN